jgi:hypothetical protein
MVQVRMRQKNIERVRLQVIGDAVHGRAGVEHHAHLGQHQTSRLPRLAGVIAAGAQKQKFHSKSFIGRDGRLGQGWFYTGIGTADERRSTQRSLWPQPREDSPRITRMVANENMMGLAILQPKGDVSQS